MGSNGLPNFGAGLALNGDERKEAAAEGSRTAVFLGRITENFGDRGIVTFGACLSCTAVGLTIGAGFGITGISGFFTGLFSAISLNFFVIFGEIGLVTAFVTRETAG